MRVVCTILHVLFSFNHYLSMYWRQQKMSSWAQTCGLTLYSVKDTSVKRIRRGKKDLLDDLLHFLCRWSCWNLVWSPTSLPSFLPSFLFCGCFSPIQDLRFVFLKVVLMFESATALTVWMSLLDFNHERFFFSLPFNYRLWYQSYCSVCQMFAK